MINNRQQSTTTWLVSNDLTLNCSNSLIMQKKELPFVQKLEINFFTESKYDMGYR